jgi:hypothetical protein
MRITKTDVIAELPVVTDRIPDPPFALAVGGDGMERAITVISLQPGDAGAAGCLPKSKLPSESPWR